MTIEQPLDHAFELPKQPHINVMILQCLRYTLDMYAWRARQREHARIQEAKAKHEERAARQSLTMDIDLGQPAGLGHLMEAAANHTPLQPPPFTVKEMEIHKELLQAQRIEAIRMQQNERLKAAAERGRAKPTYTVQDPAATAITAPASA